MKVENIKIERKSWSVDVDKNNIKVLNTRKNLLLLVNDKIQDVYIGSFAFSNVRLSGKTNNNKEIKVVCGGDFRIHCCIFVDNELIIDSRK